MLKFLLGLLCGIILCNHPAVTRMCRHIKSQMRVSHRAVIDVPVLVRDAGK